MARFDVGMDVGSVSVNLVVLDAQGQVVREEYRRHLGDPYGTALTLLDALPPEFPAASCRLAAFTGMGGKVLAETLGGPFINEVIAQGRGTHHFCPEARTIIDMGGEDAKMIMVAEEGGHLVIQDFAMNTMCAAGTGSFLDQQAHRLGYTIEEFSELALKSTTPPRVAGRCSVFAKTDMIHLQQGATPDYEIIAGLCQAMARNLKSNIGKGKTVTPPVAFQGGVAHNLGVRQAFRQVFGFDGAGLIIPPHFCALGAVGAVLVARENPPGDFSLNLEALRQHLLKEVDQDRRLPRLPQLPVMGPENYEVVSLPDDGSVVEGYLGIDVGSISTNVVVIDAEMRVLAREYLMTAGRPLEAITEGLRRVGAKIGGRVKIMGAATTGSGRYLTGDFIGADLVRNEITAQATAAAAIDPAVDTIFEIGGQDSKFISLSNGAIVDFMMNKVCAAGTGSYLEEQAEKLGIRIREEFGELALESQNPVRMGERCTVFMESDIVHHQQRGASKRALVAGLSYSIVQNYLNKVAEDRPIGKRIFYQGATAANRGIVAAFQQVCGKPVHVPPHHDVTGAIGAALLSMRERDWEVSKFKGFDLADCKYKITSFECKSCPNNCEIRQVQIEGEKPLFYGSRCEKYEVAANQKTYDLPDLLKEREDWLYGPEPPKEGKRGVIGVPRAMFFQELMPFFRAFFEDLGFTVVYSQKTNKSVINQGVEALAAEPCYPVKVAHGHLLDLLKAGVKRIFLPSIIDLPNPNPEIRAGQVCPMAQSLCYTAPIAIDFAAYGANVLSPVLYFGRGEKRLRQGLQELGKALGVSIFQVNRAMRQAVAAQQAYFDHLQSRGREILDSIPKDGRLMILIGRPYNALDPGMNLNLHRKLRQLGVLAMPMDFLPVDQVKELDEIKPMYWRFGQKILGVAEHVRRDPRLYGVFITNFGCGPDSFIQHFFKDRMRGKPYLEIEIDEHSSDVGAITRLEAFLDSLKNVTVSAPPERVSPYRYRVTGNLKRRIYLPPMTDHALGIVAAFEACGGEAEALPDSDEETLELGRRLTSGKECYPLILTTGDLAKLLKRPDFNPERSAFFMPSANGPCRFGQYHRFHRLILDELGYPQVPVYSPEQSENMYREIGMVGGDFDRVAWSGICAIDLLEKKLRECRPYERAAGESDKIYKHYLQKVYEAVRDRQDVPAVLRSARGDFDDLALNRNGGKPIVGIVGEIYTRANQFSNENAVREIEALGGEVWMPPIGEWLLYVTHSSRHDAWVARHFGRLLQIIIKDRIQKKDERRLEECFHGSIKNLKEPSIAETLELAKNYLHPSFEGEAILSMGKSRDFVLKGAAGLVNIMPFTCMPGTVVNSLFKRFREDHDNIPFLNLAYDGQEQSHTRTRLEAFMYQVRQFGERWK
ncbi:MAG: acyl-CoA dehydratase activase [Deltaproteobacteria bacterium]|nr:acyl-CoA dehydratase activase [Deltaproteobacteria bacterium]